MVVLLWYSAETLISFSNMCFTELGWVPGQAWPDFIFRNPTGRVGFGLLYKYQKIRMIASITPSSLMLIIKAIVSYSKYYNLWKWRHTTQYNLITEIAFFDTVLVTIFLWDCILYEGQARKKTIIYHHK